ncbi:MAG: diaminopimelate epimerase [Prevotella sp.]|nr:diaminopimelate epimerase [Prevotella sp.]
MKTTPFTKMHGCGNDYIYVNTMLNDVPNPSMAAVRWSDRHKGVGADGLVLIGKSPVPEADFSMRIFNADGSEAMMCGNASRCIAKYLFERQLTNKKKIKLLTRSGVKTLWLQVENEVVESVTVDMLSPMLEDEKLFIPSLDPGQGTFVSMGNPHYVIFTDDVDQVERIGAQLERHPAFPQRCNIEFAHVESDGSIRTRVWERGSGITLACGTGACATAVAAATTGRSNRKARIVMDGGELFIDWALNDELPINRCSSDKTTPNHVYMTGTANFVFDGCIETEDIKENGNL